MIDQKLSEFEFSISLVEGHSVRADCPKEFLLELIRLARLGIWAEKHAIPALEHYESAHYDHRNFACFSDPVATDALAATPEQKEEP